MNIDNDFISIVEAASLIGVSVCTLRRWEKNNKLKPYFRTFGNHRRYKRIDIISLFQKEKRINIGYARVSSHDQKDDLERQKIFLEEFIKNDNQDYFEIISDLGSGLNYKKKGLKKLLFLLLCGKIDTIYLTHKDRLLRFGSELFFNIAQQFGTNIKIIYDEKNTFEEQLAKDVLETITVFSAKLYGSRSHKKNKKIVA